MKYTDAQHREEAKKLVRRFNDFDDLYDEAKSDIRPMMDEKEWDHFLDILGKEWKTSAKDSVSPVPIAGKFANGCPFCKANHDPGIPCRNSQPRTGLTKPQKIERDGKLVGVNMVPVGDETDEAFAKRREAAYNKYKIAKERLAVTMVSRSATQAQKDSARRRLDEANSTYQGIRRKANDSIALSRDEARTLRDVLVLGRAMDAASESLQTAQEWEKEFWSQLKEGKKANKYGNLSKKDAEALSAKLKVTLREYANAFVRVDPAERKSANLPSSIELRRYIDQL